MVAQLLSSIKQYHINFLQAIAARITSFETITVCSVYLPPSQRWEVTELQELYAQLPQPALLLGDFNAHSQSWDAKTSTGRSS